MQTIVIAVTVRVWLSVYSSALCRNQQTVSIVHESEARAPQTDSTKRWHRKVKQSAGEDST